MIWWSRPINEEQQQSFQQQVNWKYPERTVLKSWAIEARDYDIKQGNWIYFIGTVLIALFFGLVTLYISSLKPSRSEYMIVFVGFSIGFLLLHWAVYSLTFARKLLVYRFTNEGFEVAGWSRQAENQKKIFIGMGIVCSIIALFIVVLVPQAFILLFIGPGGIVLVTLSQTTNQQAWELQRDYSQKYFEWSEFEKVGLFNQRQVITLYFDKPKRIEKTGKHILFGQFHIFCLAENYNDVIIFVKSKLPNIPCSEESVEIFPSACS